MLVYLDDDDLVMTGVMMQKKKEEQEKILNFCGGFRQDVISGHHTSRSIDKQWLHVPANNQYYTQGTCENTSTSENYSAVYVLAEHNQRSTLGQEAVEPQQPFS